MLHCVTLYHTVPQCTYQNVPPTTLYHNVPECAYDHTVPHSASDHTTPRRLLPHSNNSTTTFAPWHQTSHTLPHTKSHSSREGIPQEEQTLPQEGSSGALSVGKLSRASWCTTTRPLYITTDHIWALARSPTNGETWGFGLGQNI